mmetsp:Transcript_16315/g.37577  ORF Transcript_16315/g.37577 Transcript_16315/m.37577 type:complete len:103 (-) Transcript_16315:19-327(-)
MSRNPSVCPRGGKAEKNKADNADHVLTNHVWFPTETATGHTQLANGILARSWLCCPHSAGHDKPPLPLESKSGLFVGSFCLSIFVERRGLFGDGGCNRSIKR